MTGDSLRRLLSEVAAGTRSPADAMKDLAHLPFASLEEATVDHHRSLRCGFPEVILAESKSVEQVLAISEQIVGAGEPLLATRVPEVTAAALRARFPDGRHSSLARVFHRPGSDPLPPAAPVAVLCAGTSDLGVAEEAAMTAEALGAPVERIRDVGVAGLHRLLPHQETLRSSAALVVVAGMEGALPSVVGGLTDRPVIAVPTSVGYGANLGGIAALLAMLNSCAAGITVVNIDNGFSAGFTAALIGRVAAGGGT